MNDDQLSVLAAKNVEFDPVGSYINAALECWDRVLRKFARVSPMSRDTVRQERLANAIQMRIRPVDQLVTRDGW